MSLFKGIEQAGPVPGAPGYFSAKPLAEWLGHPPKPSDKALILIYLGRAKVLEHVGDGIDYWLDGTGDGENLFESIGTPAEGDVGSSDGLYVFEGCVRSFKYWTDCGYEYDSELDGDFRELNEEEQEDWRTFGEMEQWTGDMFDFTGAWPCVHCDRPAREHREDYTESEHNPPLACPTMPDEVYDRARDHFIATETKPFYTGWVVFQRWCVDRDINPSDFLHLYRVRELRK